MDNYEILEKAVQKAINNGWKRQATGHRTKAELNQIYWNDRFTIIYNHDFAKALWGDGRHRYEWLDDDIVYEQKLWDADDGLSFGGKLWQFHLQQMVVAPDPIKYLGENL